MKKRIGLILLLKGGLLPPAYGQLAPAETVKLIPFKKESYWQGILPIAPLWGYRSADGKQVIAPQYHYAGRFYGPYAAVAREDSLGIIDEQNRVVIPFKYHYAIYIGAERFLVGYRNKYFGEYKMGVVTAGNQLLIPIVYDYISRHGDYYETTLKYDSLITEGKYVGSRSVRSTYGLCNAMGNEVLPCQFEYITWLNDSLLVVNKKQKQQALFRINGEPLTPFMYLVIDKFYDGLAKVRIGERYGFINRLGKQVIPVRLEYCEEFKAGVAMIRQQQQWGAINTKGKVIIKPRYSYEQVAAQLKARQF
jgi:hypothetical protein